MEKSKISLECLFSLLKIKRNYEQIENGLNYYKDNITEKDEILEEDIIKMEKYENKSKMKIIYFKIINRWLH